MQEARKRALLIINSRSGRRGRTDAGDQLRKIFHSHGIPCTVRRFGGSGDLGEMAAAGVRAGAGLVAVAGGDGSMRAAAQALAGTGVPIAVLPAGTLNHFARDLQIPLDLNEAAQTAVTGIPVSVDLASVNGRVFVNNSVIGAYPAYRLEREANEARGLSRPAAVAACLWRLMRRLPSLTIRLRTPEIEVVRRTSLLIAGNNEHAMEGLAPWQRELLTEGALWVYLLRGAGRRSLLRTLVKGVTGTLRGREEFEVLRAEEVVVETGRRPLNVSLDGEIFALEPPLLYRSLPRELRVIVPRGSPRVAESLCELPGGAQSG